ncbi:MAG: A/G-specific adenine glycosylase [Arachnia sp.]
MKPATERLARWFADNGRPLPWRSPTVGPWGVLVSEVMLQQTPVTRVIGVWLAWLDRWPTPAALAAAPRADVIRAWGRLGYPRRAIRLHETAVAIQHSHGGQVPSDEAALLRLPGIGSYTAAAVMAFGFGKRSLVLDVNVRRVLARWVDGNPRQDRHESVAERRRAAHLVPRPDQEAAAWSAAIMELGALVCTAAQPACEDCPLQPDCAWLAAGRPEATGPAPRTQAWVGTDRQCRGTIMAAVRASQEPVALREIAWPDEIQLHRCAHSLSDDGLATTAGGLIWL